MTNCFYFSLFSNLLYMWTCKACSVVATSRLKLLQHYRLKHRHFGRNSCFPCVYLNCPCSFRTWNALKIHLNRFHVTQTRQRQSKNSTFNCHICNCGDLYSEKDYWAGVWPRWRSDCTCFEELRKFKLLI